MGVRDLVRGEPNVEARVEGPSKPQMSTGASRLLNLKIVGLISCGRFAWGRGW